MIGNGLFVVVMIGVVGCDYLEMMRRMRFLRGLFGSNLELIELRWVEMSSFRSLLRLDRWTVGGADLDPDLLGF